jgi:hypothetical protein
MANDPVPAYAQLNMRIPPMDRGDQFEEPLMQALEKKGLGEVAGGGTMQRQSGEIEYCGIDVDLYDVEKGAAFVREFLTRHGAPRGSSLQFAHDGKKVAMPFGVVEGIAVYFNGTDLPDDVYRECDINFAIEKFDELLGGRGTVRSHWQGPKETALYLYGASAEEMRQRIAAFMAEYPLCEKARVETIA